MRKRKKWLRVEAAISVLGALMAILFSVAGPKVQDVTRADELVAQNSLKSERIEVLEALLLASHRNNNALRAQLAENNLLRNKAYSQLDEIIGQRNEAIRERDALTSQFAKQRSALEAELAAATERIRDLNNGLQLANTKVGESQELASKYALAKERDAALDKAKQAEDRVRELTLKLSQNGIWP